MVKSGAFAHGKLKNVDICSGFCLTERKNTEKKVHSRVFGNVYVTNLAPSITVLFRDGRIKGAIQPARQTSSCRLLNCLRLHLVSYSYLLFKKNTGMFNA